MSGKPTWTDKPIHRPAVVASILLAIKAYWTATTANQSPSLLTIELVATVYRLPHQYLPSNNAIFSANIAKRALPRPPSILLLENVRTPTILLHAGKENGTTLNPYAR